MAPRCALVAGATGLVGGLVVEHLRSSSDVSRVVVLVRRSSGLARGKVEEAIVDFRKLDEKAFEGVDDAYLCLGTTIKKAGSQAAFYEVDHDYTLAVAKPAKRAGATRCALVSAIGASPDAGNFYNRVKGETDRDVEAIGFDDLVIVRPSFLLGERNESRPGERIGAAMTRALGFALVGGLSKFRAIDARHVARAMIAALPGAGPKRILLHDEMEELSRRL
jgi:uncharacterized protein YbjT (DUF2867 family)